LITFPWRKNLVAYSDPISGHEEDLAHLWPARFAHVHRYGKYQFDVETARARVGLRPLQQ
jgi:hypothetical protein